SLPCELAPHPRPPHSFPTRRSSDLRGGVSRADPTVSSGLRPSPSRPLPELPPRHSLRSAPAPRRPKPPRRPAHRGRPARARAHRSEEHTSELQSRFDLVCRLLLEKK